MDVHLNVFAPALFFKWRQKLTQAYYIPVYVPIGLFVFYFIRSQMINQEDYTMIADYDCMGVEERGKILEQKGDQVLK